MRFLYSFLFYLAMPYVLVRLLWRSRRLPRYRQRVLERFGHYPFKLEKCLWVHAVSVGETIAAVPLVKALQVHYPSVPLLMTTMTPTGAARVKAAFGDSVTHVYVPYDLPGAVKRFLNSMDPRLAIIMETELWPNLIAATHGKKIPICLLNARLSEKSAKGYHRIASLTRDMLQQIDMIAAHGHADAARFLQLGAPKNKVMVTGNIKFDLELPAELIAKSRELRASLGEPRFIWIAASTHEGEEEIILAAHQQLRAKDPNCLLVLVPRHPDRFDTIAKYSNQLFATQRRSQVQSCDADTAVYIGDTMGELLLMYGAADVAFVGGSLVARGGHNILEPAALAKPILTGPHLFNFKEISELFFAANALTKVNDANSLAEHLIKLMHDPNEQKAMGHRALQVIEANRGALAKQVEIIQHMLK